MIRSQHTRKPSANMLENISINLTVASLRRSTHIQKPDSAATSLPSLIYAKSELFNISPQQLNKKSNPACATAINEVE